MFSFKIKMNSTNKIINRLGMEENGRANKFLRDEVDRLCDPYVPMASGTLKNTKQYPSNHEIKYVMPYAHYMYIGKKAVGSSRPKGVKRTISNQPLKYSGAPKRGAKWEKRMMSDKGQKVVKDLQKYIKNGAK